MAHQVRLISILAKVSANVRPQGQIAELQLLMPIVVRAFITQMVVYNLRLCRLFLAFGFST